MELKNPALLAIRQNKGLATKLGKELGITREAVWMWRKVPGRHAVRVAKMLKLRRHDVCPEIFPPPPKKRKSNSSVRT